MLGFVGIDGAHTIVAVPDMVPRSLPLRLRAIWRTLLALFRTPDRLDEEENSGPVARLRYERLFQRFAAYFQERQGTIFLVWNGTKGTRRIAVAAARSVGTDVIFMELAPLPGRISIDRQGVNYGSSFPRDPAFFMAWKKSLEKLEDWRSSRARITARALRRPSGGRMDEVGLDELPRRYIFCPLQVPGDSQITTYGGWIRSIEKLIEEISRAAKHVPEGWGVVVKQHPSSEIDFRTSGRLGDASLINGDAIPTVDLIRHASLIVTVNSSVGLEACLFDKPVVVLGQAIYGVDGFCRFASDAGKLQAIFEAPETVDFDPELRAALIRYLQQEYLFEETDVAGGRVTLDDIIARDRRVAELMALKTTFYGGRAV